MASRVSFAWPGSGAVGFTESRDKTTPTREDGNNVDLDAETLSNIDTQLRYQLASQAMSSKFSQISTAVKG